MRYIAVIRVLKWCWQTKRKRPNGIASLSAGVGADVSLIGQLPLVWLFPVNRSDVEKQWAFLSQVQSRPADSNKWIATVEVSAALMNFQVEDSLIIVQHEKCDSWEFTQSTLQPKLKQHKINARCIRQVGAV